jgi:hypothetical protein
LLFSIGKHVHNNFPISALNQHSGWVDVSGTNEEYLNIFRFESKSYFVLLHDGLHEFWQRNLPALTQSAGFLAWICIGLDKNQEFVCVI